jgi:hypothetical protein
MNKGLRLVVSAEPPGSHPRAPRGAVWRRRSDNEIYWIMTITRDSATLDLVSKALAILMIDEAVQFLPVVLMPPQPGMAIFQRDGSITDNLREEITPKAKHEMMRIGGHLKQKHRKYVDGLAAFFRTGEPSDNASVIPPDHPLWKMGWEGVGFFYSKGVLA